MSILHTLSTAFNPEDNGEAERAVQKVKAVISHASDDLKSITSCVANLNYDQRTDGSGSTAELFLQRTLRVPGLAHIPSHLWGIDDLKAACSALREKQVSRTQNQCKPEVFVRNQRVVIQNNITNLWNIKARIINRRTH